MYTEIPGSYKAPVSPAKAAPSSQPVDCNKIIHATIVLNDPISQESRQEVQAFAAAHGLSIVDPHDTDRTMLVSGPVAAMQVAFGTQLDHYEDKKTGCVFRARTGPLGIPNHVAPHVMAVLGLDTRPAFHPHYKKHSGVASPESKAVPLNALQVARAYKFPTDVTGKGVTVALIELGGGYTAPDNDQYFHGLGLQTPNIESVSVLGATNNPSDVDSSGEVLLDIQVLGAVAPGVNTAVYYAPNSDQGFVEAIAAVTADKTRNPQVISISWGGPEDSWTSQAINAMSAVLQDAVAAGITVFCAAGDSGASDSESGLHVDFPGSSPYVTCVGGTKLILNGPNVASQQAWNETPKGEGATGGGYSNIIPMPAYQKNIKSKSVNGQKMRAVPDVASVADPETGFEVVIGGWPATIGGTSSGSPLWAGLIALCVEKNGGRGLGLINPKLYSAPSSAYWDVRLGNNADTSAGGYSTSKGWDACTGLGTPIGTRIETVLLAA